MKTNTAIGWSSLVITVLGAGISPLVLARLWQASLLADTAQINPGLAGKLIVFLLLAIVIVHPLLLAASRRITVGRGGLIIAAGLVAWLIGLAVIWPTSVVFDLGQLVQVPGLQLGALILMGLLARAQRVPVDAASAPLPARG